MGSGDLERAIAEAVERSRPVAEGLRKDVRRLLRALSDCAGTPALGAAAGEESSELRSFADDLVRQVTAGLQEVTDRRLGALDTFNVVLFGRTGAGKSSLREALTQGHGTSISPHGAADWTTEVTPGEWQGCRVIDTPGIAGWGRTMARSELEERAREALVIADVVILCFDSQNQQAAEFAKVADWIAAYGKPVVAVLNNRSPVWRRPTRVRNEAVRRHLSRAVAEHAQNIHDELARVGLHDVPIVALNTKSAVFARVTLPYEGPDADTLPVLRAEAGSTGVLLDWSNLPALEGLMGAALGKDAVGLRLGTLVRQIEGACLRADDDLRIHVEEPALRLAEQAEIGIERMLTVLGAPESAFAETSPDGIPDDIADASPDGSRGGSPKASPKASPEGDAGRKLLAALAELERLRGGRFEAPPVGEIGRYADHLIRAALAPQREAAQRRADTVVDQAMAHGEVVGPEAFAAQVFDTPAIEFALKIALEAVVAQLQRRVSLVVEDVGADLRAVATERAQVQGNAGRFLRGVSIATGVGGVAAGAGTGVMAGLIIFNAWNPVGWTAGGILLVGAIAGMIGRGISKWSRRRARHRKEEALAQARADARRAVTDTFERARTATVAQVNALVRRGMSERVGVAVVQAVELRGLAEGVAHCRSLIRETAEGLPAAGDPAQVLREAARERESATGLPGQAAAAHLWLGESWCTEDGIAAGAGRHRTVTAEPFEQPEFLAWVRQAADGPFAEPAPGAGRDWLLDAQDRLREDAAAAEALAQLDELAADGRPRVLVCGDYNTGKSSFIRRLLLDAGEEPPQSLAVAAAPKTAKAEPYTWKGVTLVDSPGFQSGRDAHTEAARLAVPDAAAVIYLFSPNLVMGERADLAFVLDGDPDAHRPAKFDRTMVILNRTDQIGPDPFDAPREFRRLCGRKRVELAQALNATAGPLREGEAVPERVLCVSGDPYGFHGGDREHFDPYRHWDGMAAFYEAFAVLRRRLFVNGLDVSLLHGGLARFGALVRDARAGEQAARERADQLGRLRADVADRLREGLALREARAERLAVLVGDFLDREVARALRTTDPEERKALAERLEEWTQNEDLRGVVTQWREESAREIEAWRRATARALRRRLESKAFDRAFPDADTAVDLRFLSGHPGRERRKKAAKGTGGVGAAVAKAADAKVIAKVFTWLNRTPNPAALARGAVVLSRLGVGLQMVGTAVDLVGLIRDERESRELVRARRAAITDLHKAGTQWGRLVADGTDETPGLLAELADECAQLAGRIEEIDKRAEAYERETAELRDRIAAYRGVIDDALVRLGRAPGGHPEPQPTGGMS
ncbi:GTPase [Actinacidiphila acididurans]|uniref:50S ribosome-binding GTPase n=1 Tax=Actinacidiphila acididurans TaxID=2784346 RepID=A0ABS2TWU9_9ACTN|nr:GTPase [Actinacidiphila acididurans]MBM9507823.1 50S ribosome-binding GTPase [Actinacidiphila acididurans]